MSKLYVRCSDNVLERKDWTMARLEFGSDGCVVDVDILNQGVYSVHDMVGWGFPRLAKWQDYDPTGNHPEQYCEVSADGSEWDFLLSEGEVRALAGEQSAHHDVPWRRLPPKGWLLSPPSDSQ